MPPIRPQSRGRRYAEPASPTRNAFRRDCDRIIHSSAFRRLAHKTQVFVYHEGDHYRTQAHPYAGSRPDRPLAGARARARRGPRRGAGAGARSRPSAVRPRRRARARRGACAASAASITTRRRCASSPSWSAAMPPSTGSISTWETLEGLVKHNGPLTDRAGQPVGALSRARRAGGDPRLHEIQDLELWSQPSAEAQVAALSDDIAYDAHDIDDGLRADLFTLDDIAAVGIVGDIVREIDAAMARPRAGAPRARDGAPPDHPHDRGCHRRNRSRRAAAHKPTARPSCARRWGRWWRFRRRWKKPTPTSRAFSIHACTGTTA